MGGYFGSVVLSVLLHVVLLALLAVGFGWQPDSRAAAPAPTVLAIQAAVVDESMIVAELERLEQIDASRRQREEDRQRAIEEAAAQARAEREREQKRLAALREQEERESLARRARERDEAQKIAQLEAQRESEEKRLAEVAAEQKTTAAELERLEQARVEAEREAQRLAREREEAEKKAAERKAAEEKRRQAELAEQRRKEAETRERTQREAELQRLLGEERRRLDAEGSGLLAEYVALIEQRIERNWVRPPSAGTGLDCEVRVKQIPGGEVIEVKMGQCNGDAAVLRSIEAAVYKASPLPPPPDPSLFERNLVIRFVPD